jgi:hypothetical protein
MLPAILRIVGLAGVCLRGGVVRVISMVPVISMDLSNARMLPVGGSKNNDFDGSLRRGILQYMEVCRGSHGCCRRFSG